MATNERVKGVNKTTWHNVVAYGKQADVIAQYFRKGSRILIYGRKQDRKYKNRDGVDVYICEVMVRDFEFVDKRSDNYDGDSQYGASDQPPVIDDDAFDDDIPF